MSEAESGPIGAGDKVTVRGYRGIAFAVLGDTMVDDADTHWSGYQVPTGDLNVQMIGDDRVFVVERGDCTRINEGDYCRGCGQTGCTHDTGA